MTTTTRPESGYARPECPDPSRWSAPDGIATEVDVSTLIGAFVLALKPDIVVETGSYLGDTTEAIGHALKMLGRGRLFTIECDRTRALAVADRVRSLPVDVAYGSSLEVGIPAPVDLFFLDSEYDARVAEVQRFRPSASPRAVIIAHDTVVDDYRRKLDTLADQKVCRPWVYLPTPRGLGVTRYR